MSAAEGARTPGKAGRKTREETRRRARGTLAPLVAHVLRSQLRSVVIWGLSLGLLSVITVASFPSFEGTSDLNELVESYPPEMREFFGLCTTIRGHVQETVTIF